MRGERKKKAVDGPAAQLADASLHLLAQVRPRDGTALVLLGRYAEAGQAGRLPAPSLCRYMVPSGTLLYGEKGVLNGHSSARVSLWDWLMFGRLAMGCANAPRTTEEGGG